LAWRVHYPTINGSIPLQWLIIKLVVPYRYEKSRIAYLTINKMG